LFGVALRFLTRLPLPNRRYKAGDLRRAAWAFPLVGLVVAGAGVAARAALEAPLGRGPATVAAVAAMVMVTGALHEDGLADTADGLWGGHDPARRLAIMRDSRIGTYGVLALTLAITLRVMLLSALDLAGFARATALGHVLGRAAWLPVVRLLPSASPGLGAELRGGQGLAGWLATTAVSGAALVVATGGSAIWWALVPLAAAGLALTGSVRLLRRRLGGFTGDTLGFVQQVVELSVLAAVVGLSRAGAV
jgi:adenosylcobinamide-GDP ribazoletransferase